MTCFSVRPRQAARFPAPWPLLFALLLGGCAQTGYGRMGGDEFRIRYARIVDVRREPLPTVAPVGAIVGGFTGLALSRNRSLGSQVLSGVGGAALGGLATRALEGERLAYAYELLFTDGSTSRFVTEKGFLRRDDCVAVERGRYANLRRVEDSRCAVASSPRSADLEGARQCHAAKEALLAAGSDAEVQTAARKVELLCQFDA